MASWLLVAPLLVISTVVDSNRDSATATIRQRVDLIELNHFVDEDGREVFRQVIFYDWSEKQRRFHVRAWRLIKNDRQLPQRRWNPAIYQCTWHDDSVLREVWAPQLRETWSQQDPERVNRALLPEDQRIPLLRPEQQPEHQIADREQP